jgi:glycolate oxidase FAD binding subunit
MNEAPLIDDFRPLSLLRPQSVAELGEIVRRAAAEGHALYPVGGGTMLHLGNPPTKPGHAVDLRGLDQVIDYPARDMTITVQAGITIAKLQDVLAKENQRLPVDVPHPETATLGGAIAVNASGPRRYGFGTLRDYVIGISFTDDNGHEVKAGGRVVKNVAGYDLCKLQIGALGTLGIVTQVTLKVLPIPEDSKFIHAYCNGSQLHAALEQVHNSKTRPASVDVFPGAEVAADGRVVAKGYALLVGFEGSTEATAWQVDQLQRDLVPVAEKVQPVALAAPGPKTIAGTLDSVNETLALKANVRPSALMDLVSGAEEFQPNHWWAHAGNGIFLAQWSGELPVDRANQIVGELRRRAALGGVIIVRCPPAWKRELMVWGEPRGDWALMRRVKRELDPRDLFNPGRFLVTT